MFSGICRLFNLHNNRTNKQLPVPLLGVQLSVEKKKNHQNNVPWKLNHIFDL